MYTVSSGGRQIGVTDLAFERLPGRSRSGWFHPNAGLAEALHRVDSLDLTLHREDGSLVPTELVGIQDTEQLLDLGNRDDASSPAEEETLDPVLEAAVEHDLRIIREQWGDEDDWFADSEWDEIELWRGREPDFPRYQIHVMLAPGVELP